jgi:hypothetical protein
MSAIYCLQCTACNILAVLFACHIYKQLYECMNGPMNRTAVCDVAVLCSWF